MYGFLDQWKYVDSSITLTFSIKHDVCFSVALIWWACVYAIEAIIFGQGFLLIDLK